MVNYKDDPASTLAERAIRICQFAKEFEESGNYEAAIDVMRELWPSVEGRPQTEGLEHFEAAEVLLRAGTLLVFTGGVKHPEGNYESAKNLISESIRLFEAIGRTDKVVEAQTELAHCYARGGAYDDARSILRLALSQLGNSEREQKVATLLRSSIVEASATRFNDALQLLLEAAPLIEASTNHARKGQFHAHFAIVLEMLGKGENRADYADRALIEHAAASFHFERAGHTRYYACGENNIGLLHLKAGRFTQAHEHLDRARRLFTGLNDRDSVAQVDDTRARVFIEQQKNREAGVAAREAVQALENSGQQRLFAEALTTWGTALARLGRQEEARRVLQRAFEVAEQAGALEEAGTAELTMLEELGEHLAIAELRAIYELADHL
ncbi:MAG TPA: hypothetical protein VD835_06040, partial [Pyrinomonadaceae bacterium]|nr:hypothetical protein [Pyrinomonadaceae bacterium]